MFYNIVSSWRLKFELFKVSEDICKFCVWMDLYGIDLMWEVLGRVKLYLFKGFGISFYFSFLWGLLLEICLFYRLRSFLG